MHYRRVCSFCKLLDGGICTTMLWLKCYESLVESVSIKYGLRTADCGLGIKYGLGIKRGLQTADWV